MSHRFGPCVYVNTSIVVRALNPAEPGHEGAKRILEECCSRCRCVYSTVHQYEIPEPYRQGILAYLARYAELVQVDLESLRARARSIIVVRGLSASRELDLMHLEAASTLECRYILARDRFIWSNAKYYGLEYVNWETHGGKCPCLLQESGASSETRQASSSSSSQRSRKPSQHSYQKQRKSTSSGSTAR